MIKGKTFAVIGGDKRQIEAAKSIKKDGNKVFIYGFDLTEIPLGLESRTLDEIALDSDYIILPVPTSKDMANLFAPLSKTQIKLHDLKDTLASKKVFCTLVDKLESVFPNSVLADYSQREEFKINNAIPTSEGAIAIAMKNCDFTINGSNVLVAGFGRVGKTLSLSLRGLGANVSVSARSLKDLALIKSFYCRPIVTSEIINYGPFDIIFNTIPNIIFDEFTLKKVAKNSLVIDLASMPGGVDFDACKRLGINAIHALALPGKVAPITAGEIVKSTIYNMIKEG